MTRLVDSSMKSGLSRLPLLALGFRPFYLVAAGFGVVAVPLWLLMYAGVLLPMPGLNGITWHIHEMLFGFATAVIAGFLLTAVRNWTGQPTPTGPMLGALVALWLTGRVLIITGPVPLAAIVDATFLPALGLAILRPIWRSRNSRNYKVVGIIAMLAILNATFHLAYLGLVPARLLAAAYATSLDIIVLLITVIAGRVIPAFTANALPDANPRRLWSVEILSVGTLIGVLIIDLTGVQSRLSNELLVILLVVAGLAHTIRLSLWSPLRTRTNALLFMLPLAYAWLPVHLALRAAAELGFAPHAAATHALTIGAMASLMIAMMMRSALGHTGRALHANKAEIAAFVSLQLAALVRVVAAVAVPAWNLHAALCSGLFWTLGFIVFVVAYLPVLMRPRIDRQPG